MKKIFFILLMLSSGALWAQQAPNIVLQLQTSDTLVHKSVVNQIGNLKKEFPDAEIDLVCHGPGLEFLLKEKSRYINKLHKMNLKGVSYTGCEFTMSQKNIKKEALVDFVKTVPYGIAEIIKKQQQNWLYVKLGF